MRSAESTDRDTQAVWLALVALVLLLGSACGREEAPRSIQVIAIDETSIARTSTEWPAEVVGMTRAGVEEAIQAGAGEVHLIGVGPTLDATARVAQANLLLDCPNERRCAEDLAALAAELATVAGEIAATPVQQPGTDLFATFETSIDICRGRGCRVLVLTDGLDSRLMGPASVEELLARYQPGFPSLEGVVVHLVGLGANTGRTELVAKAEAFWHEILTEAGAMDIRIGRSI